MKVGWFKSWLSKPGKVTPDDHRVYQIDRRIIDFTVCILQEYGMRRHAEEGVVYWAGTVNESEYKISAAIAPKVKASRYGFFTDHNSNARFVEFINDNDLVYISQVHSHPGKWVDHSPVDDEGTAFRSEGLLSVVVPCFGRNGMLPLTSNGIHRYHLRKFTRLSNAYVKKHFKIINTSIDNITLKDFRYE
jgi:hypothetical protein